MIAGVLPLTVILSNVLLFLGGVFFESHVLVALALVSLGAGWSGIIYASLYESARKHHHPKGQ